MSFVESHGDILLRNVFSLDDVAESTFSDWVAVASLCVISVVPVPGILSFLSVSSPLIVHVVILIAGVLLRSINRYHCYFCG